MTEKVFVPKFPGIPVFENYRGVPANDFNKTAVYKLSKFVKRDDIYVQGDDIVVGHERIRPTKFGYTCDRFWLFDQNTLKDINFEIKRC